MNITKKAIVLFLIIFIFTIIIYKFIFTNLRQENLITKEEIVVDSGLNERKISKSLDDNVVKDFSFSIPWPLEILEFDHSLDNWDIWLLAMKFDPSIKDFRSNYYIVKIKKDKTIVQYNTKIPVWDINTPYRAKAQVKFFKIIDNKYLNIGIKHLDWKMYILKYDINHINDEHFTMDLKLDSASDSANMFLWNNWNLFFVWSKDWKPFILSIDKNQKTVFEKGNIVSFHNRRLKYSKLLNNNYLLLAFNSYTWKNKLTSILVLIDDKWNIVKQKTQKWLVINMLPTINNSVLVIFAYDQTWKNMGAKVFNTELIVDAKFKISNFFEIMDSAWSLISNGNKLISLLIDRLHWSHKLVDIYEYSEIWRKNIWFIKNKQPNELRAYNTAINSYWKNTYIWVAIIGIGKKNRGYKTYTITTLKETKKGK